MGGGASTGLADAVRGLLEAGTGIGATDGELLERFASRRDEAAFAALVERHGPMVLRSCRAELRDEHEALDAFQAAFLVLARKGGTLRSWESLGPWLHRVALRTCGRARRAGMRRRAAELRAAETAASETLAPDPDREEAAAAVQEEVDRLPARYRAVVVLCDLEGITFAEAAARLGSPVGTVASRLARGHDRLRDRLRRRGFDPGAGAICAPPAILPAGLAEAVASAAVRFLSSSTAPQGAAAILALGVLRTMTWNACWKAAAIMLALGASTTGVVALAARESGEGREPRQDQAAPAKSDEEPAKDAPPEPEAAPRTFGVRPGRLQVTVRGRGVLRPLRDETLRCPLSEADVKVVSILTPGTRVGRGDVVVRLESPRLQEQLERRRAAVLAIESEASRLERDLDIAKLALVEYEQAVFPADRASAQGRIKAAEQALAAIESRVGRARKARDRADRLRGQHGEAASPTEILAELELEDRVSAAELALIPARAAVEGATAKLDALERFTRPRTVAQLRADVEKIRVALEAKRSELKKEAELHHGVDLQVASCDVRSPVDGVVVAAALAGALPVKAGAGVAPGQMLASIQNADGRMRVVAQIYEDQLDLLEPGRPAVVEFPSLDGRTALAGVVEAVSPFAGETTISNFGPNRTYPVSIRLLEQPPGIPLRPGLVGNVAAEIETPEDALGVPTSALVWYDGRHHVAVEKPNGEVEWREVVAGLADGGMTEIREGLEAAESVVVHPAKLLSDEQRRKASIAPSRAASGERAPAMRAEAAAAVLRKLALLPSREVDEIRNADAASRADALKKAGLTDAEVLLYEEIPAEAGGPY